MTKKKQFTMDDINQGIIQYRSSYARWAKSHHISYNELLVFYTFREYGYCTQKMICDSYLLPRQTINHTFFTLRNNGWIILDETITRGKEKVFILTPLGKERMEAIMNPLNQIEREVLLDMGEEKVQQLLQLLSSLDEGLSKNMKNIEKRK